MPLQPNAIRGDCRPAPFPPHCALLLISLFLGNSHIAPPANDHSSTQHLVDKTCPAACTRPSALHSEHDALARHGTGSTSRSLIEQPHSPCIHPPRDRGWKLTPGKNKKMHLVITQHALFILSSSQTSLSVYRTCIRELRLAQIDDRKGIHEPGCPQILLSLSGIDYDV